MSAGKTHEIVVLGANLAGLGAAHVLLRYTIPSLQRLDKDQSFHVTLVTPNTHMFFKPTAPRSLVQPSLIPESKLWRPLSEALERYPADQYTHVQAIATALDPAKRQVTIASRGVTAGGEKTITYDSLLIATGTTSSIPLWTLHDDQNLTPDAWKAFRTTLATAKTVLIAGGGPVGVEMSGEILAAHPGVEITLVSGGPRLLQRVLPETGARAQNYLETNFSTAKIVHNVTVIGAAAASDETGRTIVTLSDGSSHAVDLYIDATGGAPNSQFLPADWLDESKRVVVTGEDFRVKGNGTDDVAGMYAVGDIVAGSPNSLMVLDAMVPTVCSSIAVDIAAELKPQESEAPKPAGLFQVLAGALFGGGAPYVPKQKEFKPMKDTAMVPIGPEGGVGQLFGWQVPSWFVRLVKGKSFLTQMIDPIMSGDKYKP